ncbi:SRPBCC family protein [Nocardioides nanhaiensis]|uniref:SRPBCC family protein n=1 Tax=Nocardioides nanhaiensis TaxID=1476871 RepID=A0ABP8WRL9_9ACTN
MSGVARTLDATPEQVWQVLSDGWLYPLFVVGASRMREVDDAWPAAGASLHHSVGAWPALLDDTTSVVRCDPPSLLELRARAWPAGEAAVTFHLEAVAEGTRVRVTEDAVSGPGRLVPSPVRRVQLAWRNTETLRRLAYVVEGRLADPTTGPTGD